MEGCNVSECRKANELKSFDELNLDDAELEFIREAGWSPQDLILYCRRDGFFKENVFGDAFRSVFNESHQNMGYSEDDIIGLELFYVHRLMDAIEEAGFIRKELMDYHETPEGRFFSTLSAMMHEGDLPYAFSETRFKTNEEYEQFVYENRFEEVLEVIEGVLPPLQFQMFKYVYGHKFDPGMVCDFSDAEGEIVEVLYRNLKKYASTIHNLLLEKFKYSL